MMERTRKPAKRGRWVEFVCVLGCLASFACSIAGAVTGQALFAVSALVLLAPSYLLPELVAWREVRRLCDAAREASRLSGSRVARVYVPPRPLSHQRDGADWLVPEIEWDSPSPSVH